jgi:hypothetical protein
MSTSGTSPFFAQRVQIIEKAFHVLGKASEGEALSARMYDGLSSLNLLLKTLNTMEHLWTKTERRDALASTAGYVLTPKPGASCRFAATRRHERDPAERNVAAGIFRPAQQDVLALDARKLVLRPADAPRGRSTSGPPRHHVSEPLHAQLTYLRRIEDMVSSSDDLDMPQEWQQAMIWNLANDLETEYPVNDARLARRSSARPQFCSAS